jgi:hypothetical protein
MSQQIIEWLRNGNRPWHNSDGGVVGINLPEQLRGLLRIQQKRLGLPTFKAVVYAAIVAGVAALAKESTNGQG